MPSSPLNTASFPVPQEWDVEPDAIAVPPARRLILDIARFWRVPLSDVALRDVELCATEVLANVMEHTKARCRVTVRWTGERLRVEVVDSSLRVPEPGRPEELATCGRGLLLLERLAHSWGWHPTGPGKTMWFECAADQLTTGDQRLAVLVRAANDSGRGSPDAFGLTLNSPPARASHLLTGSAEPLASMRGTQRCRKLACLPGIRPCKRGRHRPHAGGGSRRDSRYRARTCPEPLLEMATSHDRN